MLSIFPQILFLAPLGTTLLRVAAAVCFAYMLWFFWREGRRMVGMPAPIVGHVRGWMVSFGEIIIAVLTVLLLVGAWTQVVAIFGALVVIKQLIFFRRFQEIFPYERSTYWLLLCICLVLVVSGAGAFAFDLPL